MFRLWGKIMKNSRFRADHVIELDKPTWTREMKTDAAIDAMLLIFDIEKPMWLSDNDKDYKAFNKTSFHQHHFIETIPFDYFEIEVIEDDED